MIECTVICAIACGALVAAERAGNEVARRAAKLVASLAFVAVGALARTGNAYGDWMLAGLVLGAIGDVALLGRSRRAFAAGLGAFLLGHLAYIAGIAQRVPPDEWLARAGTLAALPIVAAALVVVTAWRRLGALRVAVIAYAATIATMMIGALAARAEARLAAGAALFFASDLAVARDRFVARSFVNKAWGLPAYYAGQLAIAWSLAG
jgi:uncharacterized membrane protein YhhN